MVHSYKGNFKYDKWSVPNNAPEEIGVYYCGYINTKGNLSALYVGRAVGIGVTIKSRLLDHLREDNWPDVTHFGYCICDTKREAEDFEREEIKRLKPKYNSQGKTLDWSYR